MEHKALIEILVDIRDNVWSGAKKPGQNSAKHEEGTSEDKKRRDNPNRPGKLKRPYRSPSV